MRDYVNIYLVDMKYASNELALKYSKAPDYVKINHACIQAMRENQPIDIIDNGLMKKGVIIRHLILPGHTTDSIDCLNYINAQLGPDTIVSIMSQ